MITQLDRLNRLYDLKIPGLSIHLHGDATLLRNWVVMPCSPSVCTTPSVRATELLRYLIVHEFPVPPQGEYVFPPLTQANCRTTLEGVLEELYAIATDSWQAACDARVFDLDAGVQLEVTPTFSVATP